ncbi:MAG TPA: D-aminoacyl-tRNA deacylase [Desulfohalobiaceae bacterium]|nr:D-aminoacyl-tRNA deacylase [Desulfohalobiaceae bacterium]
MRIIAQRVKQARVDIQHKSVATIGQGLLLLVGFSQEDITESADSAKWCKLRNKISNLRIFPDQNDKSNLSLEDIKGEVLVVSQFTLYADCKKGKRPSFTSAAPAGQAKELYNRLIHDLKTDLPGRVKSGIFGAEMELWFCNWGPVTIILDSKDF